MHDPQSTKLRQPASLLSKAFFKASSLVASVGLLGGIGVSCLVLRPADAAVVSGLLGGVGACGIRALFYRDRFDSYTQSYEHFAANGRDAKLAAAYMAVGAAVPFVVAYGLRL